MRREAPFVCPSCGGDDIDMAVDIEYDGPESICYGICFICDAQWRDIYLYDRREVDSYGRVDDEGDA